jgi:hypothetical protein
VPSGGRPVSGSIATDTVPRRALRRIAHGMAVRPHCSSERSPTTSTATNEYPSATRGRVLGERLASFQGRPGGLRRPLSAGPGRRTLRLGEHPPHLEGEPQRLVDGLVVGERGAEIVVDAHYVFAPQELLEDVGPAGGAETLRVGVSRSRPADRTPFASRASDSRLERSRLLAKRALMIRRDSPREKDLRVGRSDRARQPMSLSRERAEQTNRQARPWLRRPLGAVSAGVPSPYAPRPHVAPSRRPAWALDGIHLNCEQYDAARWRTTSATVGSLIAIAFGSDARSSLAAPSASRPVSPLDMPRSRTNRWASRRSAMHHAMSRARRLSVLDG